MTNQEPGSSSCGNRKFLIKFKVAKTSGFDGSIEEERFHNGSPEKENWVCKLCEKGFSSGKALGGHMRVHQIKDNDLNQNLQLTNLEDCNANGNPETNNNTTCSICGKNFPSKKALFGHMRCHPEREWRGINPPEAAAKTSSLLDSIDRKADDQIDLSTVTGILNSDFDLAQYLAESRPRWSSTGKRGRKSIAPKEKIPEIVYDLMLLANGNSNNSGLSDHQGSEESEGLLSNKAKIEDRDHITEYLDPVKKRKFESGNRDLVSNKLKIDEDEEIEDGKVESKLKRLKGGEEHGIPETEFEPEQLIMDSSWDDTDGLGEDSKQNSGEGSDSKNTDHSIPGKQLTYNSEIAKGKKKIKFKDLETDGDIGLIIYQQMPFTSDRYKCSTCNKSFPTHQALGGHRSSHKKGKNILPIEDIEESAFAGSSAQDEMHVDNLTEFGEAGPKLLNGHRCKICNKTFPTGQALGGHKRCHWSGPVEAAPSSVALPEETSRTVELPEETTKTGRGVLDFDLNEVPVMEYEKGLESTFSQFEQPVNYASSLYNSVT
ncbi:hypothetical protein HHK36_021624 [Tetracentron sinense]|uniref:C2H2-type domain-containing protein n=1 Tax=Tetracentron sinense TaxID=13715 RepID=A0A834YXC5_TETSI|nr:hypothetical protein HHK36_021624 [Tetracentron sinense]